MKKAAVILLSTMIAFSLLGCSGNMGGTNSPSTQSNDSQQTATNDAFSMGSIADTGKPDARPNTSQGAAYSRTPTGTPNKSRASESKELAGVLSATVQPIVKDSGMDVSVTVIDLDAGRRASINGERQMHSASMIKLLIAAAFMDKVESGALSLEDAYALQEEDIVGGAGTLGGLDDGAEVTYGDLVTHMIDVSDNTAANILIRSVGGMAAVNSKAAALGLSKTRLNRFFMDEEAVSRGIENYTSADDVATLLEMIYNGTLGTADSCQFILDALRLQQDDDGIAQGLPADTPFAHKTGALATVRHDGGIVEGAKPYVIVVMCGGEGFNEEDANITMSDIASAVNDSFSGG